MYSYLSLLQNCANHGVRQKNRTGIDTLMIPGGALKFDFDEGFPILTTKKVNFKAVVAELLGFIRGYTNAAQFRELGCRIWDANANANKQWLENPARHGPDDLGRIYGAQWRGWRGIIPSWDTGPAVGVVIDQLARALDLIRNDPTSRRIIVSAWQPAELDRMALPPCHLMYQFLVEQERRRLHMTMYMRSCDMFLGVPFNISSYALLLSLVAMVTEYAPGTLTMFLADVHIYENHRDQVREQLRRVRRKLPRLVVSPRAVKFVRNQVEAMSWLESIEPEDIELVGYDPHPAIKGDMAV